MTVLFAVCKSGTTTGSYVPSPSRKREGRDQVAGILRISSEEMYTLGRDSSLAAISCLMPECTAPGRGARRAR
eukprot:2703167-Rhodomonas_salina.1